MNADKRGYPWERVIFLLCVGRGNDRFFDFANRHLVALSAFICVHLRFSGFRVVNGYEDRS